MSWRHGYAGRLSEISFLQSAGRMEVKQVGKNKYVSAACQDEKKYVQEAHHSLYIPSADHRLNAGIADHTDHHGDLIFIL